MGRYVVGMSGASGAVLTLKTVKVLAELGHEIEFVMSKHAVTTAVYELGIEVASPRRFIEQLDATLQTQITIHTHQNVGATIASGTYKTDGMIIVPCSMATIAAVAHGFGDNCLKRAADVTLKERRPLVVVPRESPLSEIHLSNLLKLAQLGVHIVPPVPAWYMGFQSLDEMEFGIVGKILDALRIEHELYTEWQPKENSLV